MGANAYLGSRGEHNVDQSWQSYFDLITTISHMDSNREYIWQNLFGADNLGLGVQGTRDNRKVRVTTGLVGIGDIRPDVVRQTFSTGTWYSDMVDVGGVFYVGKAHEYYKEDLERQPAEYAQEIYGHVEDIGQMVDEATELAMIRFYLNGLTTNVGGFANTTLFVDGTTAKLQLVGRPNYFTGLAASNIFGWFGGVSYEMILEAQAAAKLMVNEEGQIAPTEIEDVLVNMANGEIMEHLFDTNYNVTTGYSNMPNPLAMRKVPRPNIHMTPYMTNDVIFFLRGWREHIKAFMHYVKRSDQWQEGNAQFAKVVNQIRSLLGYYWFTNRYVLLFRGVPNVS